MALKEAVLIWEKKIRRCEFFSVTSTLSSWPSDRLNLHCTAKAHSGLTRAKSSGIFIQRWSHSNSSEIVIRKYQDTVHVCKWWTAFKFISGHLSVAPPELPLLTPLGSLLSRQFHKYAPDIMHRDASERVSGDPQVLDMDKRNIEWNSAVGTHWKAVEREYLSSPSKEGHVMPVTWLQFLGLLSSYSLGTAPRCCLHQFGWSSEPQMAVTVKAQTRWVGSVTVCKPRRPYSYPKPWPFLRLEKSWFI